MIKVKNSSNRRSVGLALSGGSALGMSHIGVLQALNDHNISIDAVAGTSAGAIVAACFAFGVPLEEVVKKAKALSWRQISNFSYSLLGLANNQSLGKMLGELIGHDAKIEQAKIPLAVIATDINSGKKVTLTKGPLAQAVMASTCIPGLFTPVSINGAWLMDGGLVENLPLEALEELGAEVKIGVNLARWVSYKKPAHIVDVMLNAQAIMTHHQTNLWAKKADLLIEPHLENFSQSDLRPAAELIALGYRCANLEMGKIQSLIQGAPAKPEQSKTFWQKFLASLGLKA